ncbi:MAG: PAC2 family protein [Actinomycetia bacterium]|nr:PAC2 family protein [Actinomycetes bacterium]MCH9799980.1 PAC2 family protein [Actinomycetes bacterium]
MPDLIFTQYAEPTPQEGPRVLVHSFSGFMDAGSASQLAVSHLLDHCESTLIGEFDSDHLLDYRARRPRMVYDVNRFTAADIPTVTLHELTDLRGTQFLLLSGPEPDFRWQEFTSAVQDLIEMFSVGLTVGMIGIPWPAPHTRPVGVTFHATNPDLLTGHTSNLGEIEIPGHVAALLELRLGEEGRDAMGLAVQVPHYLVQFDYPRAAIALLRALAGSTGLVLPTDELEVSASAADAEIDRQTRDAEEFGPLLSALEDQYDAGVSGETTAVEEGAGSPLPDADQIGAQVERFLSEMDIRRPDSNG